MNWLKKQIKWFVTLIVTAGMAYLGGTGVWMQGKQVEEIPHLRTTLGKSFAAVGEPIRLEPMSVQDGDTAYHFLMLKRNGVLGLYASDTIIVNGKMTLAGKITPKL